MALLKETKTFDANNGFRVVGQDSIKPATQPTTQPKPAIDGNSDMATLLAQALKEIESLKAKVAAGGRSRELSVRFNNSVTTNPKTGEKQAGKLGFSVLGLNQMPVTLYAAQWVKLLKFAPSILDCIADNIDKCSVKDEADREQLAADIEAMTAETDTETE